MNLIKSPFTAFAILLILCSGLFAAETKQPDILLIMPDQMRGDCLSILGHPVVKTPNLDKLVREGALFRRAYTTIPSCIPARYALLTGLFPQTSGVVGFKSRPITCPTMPQLLADAGYRTALIGRNMHQVPEEAPNGYQNLVLGSTYREDEYDDFLKKVAPQTGGIRNLINQLEICSNGWEANPWPLADDLHPTAWIVRQARKAIANAPSEKPLFLTASFYAPHPPLFPPKKYFDKYMRKDLPAPAHGDWVDWNALPEPKKLSASHRVHLQGELLKRAQAGYFGLITHLDDQIAPLIKEFKARSKKSGRPWAIIFMTDHGEMLGDHGFFRKCEPYEGSANIPFIVAGSKELGFQRGLRCNQPVCLEDVMPTVLDLAGVKSPSRLDGVSLRTVLQGNKATLRDWLHLEHAPCYSQEQSFHALTDGHFKYIWRPLDGSEQLFNIDQDIREERDLSKDAGYSSALAEWRGRLIKRLKARPEGFSDGTKLIARRPYPALQEELNLPAGQKPRSQKK